MSKKNVENFTFAVHVSLVDKRDLEIVVTTNEGKSVTKHSLSVDHLLIPIELEPFVDRLVGHEALREKLSTLEVLWTVFRDLAQSVRGELNTRYGQLMTTWRSEGLGISRQEAGKLAGMNPTKFQSMEHGVIAMNLIECLKIVKKVEEALK